LLTSASVGPLASIAAWMRSGLVRALVRAGTDRTIVDEVPIPETEPPETETMWSAKVI
jgi:hypothetical protein